MHGDHTEKNEKNYRNSKELSSLKRNDFHDAGKYECSPDRFTNVMKTLLIVTITMHMAQD